MAHPHNPNRNMRSPTDEACWFEDEYRPMTPAESEANWAAFKAGLLAPDYGLWLARRASRPAFGG